MSSPELQRMQCMEVWGGNHAADAGVVMPGLDAWVYCQPHGAAASGGDVHYVSSCASGRITRFLLADVRGHGEPVSEIAVGLRSILRRHINLIEQTTVVAAINEEFEHLHEAGMLATAVAGTFFLPTGKLTLSNAGHPPPMLYRRKTARWEFLTPRREARTEGPAARTGGPSNVPLGLVSEAQWEKVEVPLRRGDLLLLFTDSLLEITADDGEPLWFDGLRRVVESLDPDRPEVLVRELLAGLRDATGGARFDDDTTVMLLRANALGTRLRDDLLAPLRYLRDFLRFRLLRAAS